MEAVVRALREAVLAGAVSAAAEKKALAALREVAPPKVQSKAPDPSPAEVAIPPALRFQLGLLYTRPKDVGDKIRARKLSLLALLDFGFSLRELYDLGYTKVFIKEHLTASAAQHRQTRLADLWNLFGVEVAKDDSLGLTLKGFAGGSNTPEDFRAAGFTANGLLCLDGSAALPSVIASVLSARGWSELGLTAADLVRLGFNRGAAYVRGWSYQEIVAAFAPSPAQLKAMGLSLVLI